MEVKFTVNRGIDFWEFEKCPFKRGWPLNGGLTVLPVDRERCVTPARVAVKETYVLRAPPAFYLLVGWLW